MTLILNTDPNVLKTLTHVDCKCCGVILSSKCDELGILEWFLIDSHLLNVLLVPLVDDYGRLSFPKLFLILSHVVENG